MGRAEQHNRDRCYVRLYTIPDPQGYRSGRKILRAGFSYWRITENKVVEV